jgi:hypothetical protein
MYSSPSKVHLKGKKKKKKKKNKVSIASKRAFWFPPE